MLGVFSFSPDEQRLLGGTGFHLQEGPLSGGCAEIGRFIRQSEAGRGLDASSRPEWLERSRPTPSR